MQHVEHLSELVLDEWAARELDAAERRRVEEHVAECEQCRARHHALAQDRAAFLAAAPSFQAHAARFARASPTSGRRSFLHYVPLAATSFAAMAAAALLVVWMGRPIEQVRGKGEPHIGWFVKRGELVHRGAPDEPLYPRDALRFVYSTDEPRYFALFNLDARSASVYYPPGPSAARVRAGSDVALDFSVELDEQLGVERVYALFCEHEFQLEPVRAALLATGRLPEQAGCHVDIVTLHKAAPQ